MTEQPQQRVAYLHSDAYLRLVSKATFHKSRDILLHALLRAFGFLDELNVVEAPLQISDFELERFHTHEYVQALSDLAKVDPDHPTEGALEQMNQYCLLEDCTLFPEVSAYARAVCSATLYACRLLAAGKADIAINWPGGRHHAHADRASGFCFLNDAVLATLALSASPSPPPLPPSPEQPGSLPHASPPPGRVDPGSPAVKGTPIGRPATSRVLYIDTDVHHCDGVEEAFAEGSGDDVMVLSIHRFDPGFFPGTGGRVGLRDGTGTSNGRICNVPLRAGLREATFLRAFERLIDAAARCFRPDYVVWTCGSALNADNIPGDPLLRGDGFNLSTTTIARAISCLRRRLPTTPLLLLGGGGYHPSNAARALCCCTAAALGHEIPAGADIPDECEHFEKFGPNYTLDVSTPSFREDENSPEAVDKLVSQLVARMEQR